MSKFRLPKPARPCLDPNAPLLANAEQAITPHLDELLAYDPIVHQPDRVFELHQMRIAAKHLRYTLEIFKDAYTQYTPFGKQVNAAVDSVKLLQEYLGDIHDADVLVPQLTAHLARLLRDGYGKDKNDEPLAGVHLVDFDACEGLVTLCRETRLAREKRYEQICRAWQKLQDEQTFQNLKTLLHDAAQQGTGNREQETEVLTPDAQQPAPDAIQNPKSKIQNHEQTAPNESDETAAPTGAAAAESGRRPARRKTAGSREPGVEVPAPVRRARRRVTSANAARHPGSGADSDTGAPEGGDG